MILHVKRFNHGCHIYQHIKRPNFVASRQAGDFDYSLSMFILPDNGLYYILSRIYRVKWHIYMCRLAYKAFKTSSLLCGGRRAVCTRNSLIVIL